MTSSSTRTWLRAGLIVLLTLAAYLPALRAGFVWDDDRYVLADVTMTPGGLGKIWLQVGATIQYYPMVFTTFWLEHGFWHLAPWGYHLVNVLLHAAGAILLWRVLERLSVPGAYLAAAIFALHPVHAESAAWITERKNVLCGVFYLWALLTYLRFCGVGPVEPAGPRRWGIYARALVLFVCALLSKTVACCLPAVTLLLLWWKRDRLRLQDVLPLIPMFVIGLGMGLVTAWVEKHTVGAEGEVWALSFAEHCLLAGRILWFYAGKLLWPAGLTFIYPRWQIDSGLWWQYLYPGAAVVVIISLWLLRGRIGKAPLAAVLVFAGTLVPALGFFDVFFMGYSYVADHFQYLASMALIALFAALPAGGFGMLNRRVRALRSSVSRFSASPVLAHLLSAVLLGILATVTWQQARAYKDRQTLWRHTLARNPSCWLAHNNLGVLLAEQEDFEGAAEHYHRALRARPDYLRAHLNLAMLLGRQGEYREAADHCSEALEIRPDSAEAHGTLGTVYAAQGLLHKAAASYRRALQEFQGISGSSRWTALTRLDVAETHYNLGRVLTRQNKFAEAAAEFEEALGLRPGWVEASEAMDRLEWLRATRESRRTPGTPASP